MYWFIIGVSTGIFALWGVMAPILLVFVIVMGVLVPLAAGVCYWLYLDGKEK